MNGVGAAREVSEFDSLVGTLVVGRAGEGKWGLGCTVGSFGLGKDGSSRHQVGGR